MLFDKHWILTGTPASPSQTVTVSAQSTNIRDLEAAGIGGDSPKMVKLVGIVTTAFTAGGAATLTIAMRDDSDSGMGTAVTRYTTGAIAVADLVQGYKAFEWEIPADHQQYLDFYFTVATGPMLTGKILIALATDVQSNLAAVSAAADAL